MQIIHGVKSGLSSGEPVVLSEHNYIQVGRNLQYFKMRHKKVYLK